MPIAQSQAAAPPVRYEPGPVILTPSLVVALENRLLDIFKSNSERRMSVDDIIHAIAPDRIKYAEWAASFPLGDALHLSGAEYDVGPYLNDHIQVPDLEKAVSFTLGLLARHGRLRYEDGPRTYSFLEA